MNHILNPEPHNANIVSFSIELSQYIKERYPNSNYEVYDIIHRRQRDFGDSTFSMLVHLHHLLDDPDKISFYEALIHGIGMERIMDKFWNLLQSQTISRSFEKKGLLKGLRERLKRLLSMNS